MTTKSSVADFSHLTRGRVSATVVVGVALMTLVGAPASALPTMIRLGYTDCASCHIASQGGGPLNAYGRGIDVAQSLRGGDYQPSEERRLMQDVRLVVQEQGTWAPGKPGADFFRPRLMYRNATTISKAFRISATVTGEGMDAARRPALSHDPAAQSSTIFVNTALVHYRPRETLEFAAGRDQLPSGINVPDLVPYIKSRNRLGYYDAPTQLKMYWGGKRYHVTPFVYAPGGSEAPGEQEYGAGSLAEFDVLGNQRTIAGVTIQRGTAQNGDRRMVGAYARLGFGQWGILAEHDVTDITRGLMPEACRQRATYGQVFWAMREWLVASGIGERLRMDMPFEQHLVAGKLEVAARLSSHATISVGTRVERNVVTGRLTKSVVVQTAFKTVR